MRTTLNIDDQLCAQATELSGLPEKEALINAALKALIEREIARRLAMLGGSEKSVLPIPRRKSDLNE